MTGIAVVAMLVGATSVTVRPHDAPPAAAAAPAAAAPGQPASAAVDRRPVPEHQARRAELLPDARAPLDRSQPDDLFGILRPADHLLYPERPIDAVRRLLDAAGNGDPDAMYWLSKAFEECIGEPLDPDQVRAIEGIGQLPPAASRDLRVRAARCHGMDSFGDAVALRALEREWLEQAASAGKATAQVELLLHDQPGAVLEHHPLHGVLLAQLRRALVEDGHPAYFEAEKLADYRRHAENDRRAQAQRPTLPPRSLAAVAWHVAGCRRHPGCDRDRKLHQLGSHYLPVVMAEILALEAGIDAGRLVGLGPGSRD